ncbi:MAG: biopolymer transporter ExbD [Spirochaetes bacterium]|nr:biopolymer transporter ExbD [Spirochaetota bacterium]
MRFKIPEKDRKNQLDFTPLLDIIFLVLIFFMVAATFDLNRSIQLTLPKSFISESNISEKKIVIEISADNQIALNGHQIVLNELTTEIKRNKDYHDFSFYVFGDNNASYKTIIEIIDILKLLGLNQISLVTDAKEDF